MSSQSSNVLEVVRFRCGRARTKTLREVHATATADMPDPQGLHEVDPPWCLSSCSKFQRSCEIALTDEDPTLHGVAEVRSAIVRARSCCAMLLELVQQFAADEAEVSIDSTDMETTSASAHQKARSGKNEAQVREAVVVCYWEVDAPLAFAGPQLTTTLDKKETSELLAKASNVSRPKRLFADAGYDAEWVTISVAMTGMFRVSSSPPSIDPMAGWAVIIARNDARTLREIDTAGAGSWNRS